VDTYNNFKDDQGNQLQIGGLNYASKKGKRVLSFADNVPARDIKLALSLVVLLLLEHSSVTNEKSCIHDSLMVEIKKSSKEEIYVKMIMKYVQLNKSLKMNYHMCFNIANGTKHVLHELIY
jgi:hypothetical protein